MQLELSSDQKKAHENVLSWFNSANREQFITLGGYAGTGKTTLLSTLRQDMHKKNTKMKVAFCAYTGKAASVLKEKLKLSKTDYNQDSIGTIHSLIYSPMINDKEEIVGWERKKGIDVDLIIVDEASMIDQEIWRDLKSYGIPILAVGDHGQLPPIRGSFNLMDNPQIKLEQIHRQAKDNPIIELSIIAREQGKIEIGNYGTNVKKVSKTDPDSREFVGDLLQNYNTNTLVLCGYNFSRVKLNKFIRKSLEFESEEPQVNDRVICLRNNHQKDIHNGMLGTIKRIYQLQDKEGEFIDWYHAEIEMDNSSLDNRTYTYKGEVYAPQFNAEKAINHTEERAKVGMGDLFDFGYAITVHKAQGSQAKRVILFEERFKQMTDEMWRRWLYTGITRAEEELIIVGE